MNDGRAESFELSDAFVEVFNFQIEMNSVFHRFGFRHLLKS